MTKNTLQESFLQNNLNMRPKLKLKGYIAKSLNLHKKRAAFLQPFLLNCER